MKQSIKFLILAFGLVFLFQGCDMTSLVEEDKTKTLSEEGESFQLSPLGTESFRLSENFGSDLNYPDYIEVLINDLVEVDVFTYKIRLLSRVVNSSAPNNISTTFTYRVSGTGITPSLDSFFMEIPNCAGRPLSWTPSNASSISGGFLRWNSSVPFNSQQDYSITYPGIVGLGLVNAVVTKGNVSETKRVLGPCQGIFTIQGSIYIDANEDGIKQASESGLGGFPIQLINNDSPGIPLATIGTEADGSFKFFAFEGNYSIKVVEDLINKNYNPTGPIEKNLGVVRSDLSDLDFGYKIDARKMISEFETGVILLDTRDFRFWTAELRNPGRNNSTYSRAQMVKFLTDIEGLLLPVPFNFGSDKIATALNIITRPIRSDVDAFLQQLLTAELNIVSGRGARKIDSNGNVVSDDDFNKALLLYAEPLACQALGACSTATASSSNAKVSSIMYSASTSLSDGTSVLSSFNGTGGIRTSR